MAQYKYRCTTCSENFDADSIESELIYLCPKCGKAEKNEPLKGVLTIEYDYQDLKKKLSQKEILKLTPGKFWLYPDLWPIDFKNFSYDQLIKLSLPSDQLLKYNVNGNKFWI